MNLHITKPFAATILLIILFFNLFLFKAIKGQHIEKTYVINNQVIHSKEEADPNNFHEQLIEEIIFDQINEILEKKEFDKKKRHNLLQLTAQDQAEYMALIEDDELIREEKEKKLTADRLEAHGGSRNGAELSAKASIKSGKIPYTYAKIADDIVFSWLGSSKKAMLIEEYTYNLVGISAKLDHKKRKVYVSMVLGNHKSFNEGVKYISNLNNPYSQKTYGLQHIDPIFCKKIIRHNNLMDFNQLLTIDNNVIYLETDDIKELQRLIGKKKDGLAVDILQKDQFTCQNPNIVNHNALNLGILTKRIYSTKLFKSNLANTNENKYGFKAQLGILPENLSSQYELNLVLIKNKSVCASVPQSFIIEPTGVYKRKVKLLADTVTINSRFQYKPVADSMQLSMRIPFENRKFTYKTEDIEPFLKLLNEPAFFIYDMKITAYSSIEGTDLENKRLQKLRAESIIKALEERQKEQINTNVITDFNWDDFKQDVQNTNHNIMASMQMDEAQAYIRNYGLSKELEPILQNHRYAQIDMKVTYDISGENEKPYVLKKFHNAIAENDKIMALSIQKFIMKKVLNNQYHPSVLNELEIPNTKTFAGLLMNKLWLQYYASQIDYDVFIDEVSNLNKLHPSNEYIAFNHLFLQITGNKLDIGTEATNLQTQIDKLYYTPLRKDIVDGLNIKLQFKLISYADSTSSTPKLKETCIERIKQIVDIKEESLQNSLKLADLFMENKDFSFALKTLEPWVYHHQVNEELLLTYVSLCSRYEMRQHTERFNYAMNRINEINPKKFCELLNGNYFSMKVFENNFIKEKYCEHCSTEEKMVME